MLLAIPILFAEVDGEPSARRRPKSIPRVYDQRATVVDMEAIFRGSSRETEDTLRPDALLDNRPRGVGRPVPANALPAPSMMVVPTGAETPPEEDRRLPWIRPRDLLDDDDDLEDRERNRDEDRTDRMDRDEPPLEWDRLGEGLSEMETRENEPREEEEPRQEERESERLSVRDREMRALTLEPVLRETAAAGPPTNGREVNAGPETRGVDLAPVVPPTALAAVPRPRADAEESDPVELRGSRALFQESFQRLEQDRTSSFRAEGDSSRFAPAPRPVAAPRTPPPGPSFSPAASPFAAAASPAPLTAQPFTPAESVRPAPRPADPAPRSDLMDMRRFRGDDYRVRPGGDR